VHGVPSSGRTSPSTLCRRGEAVRKQKCKTVRNKAGGGTKKRVRGWKAMASGAREEPVEGGGVLFHSEQSEVHLIAEV
jgi:hypothetical protein